MGGAVTLNWSRPPKLTARQSAAIQAHLERRAADGVFADISAAIRRERDYQDRRFPNGKKHSLAAFMLIMRNELAEAEHAWTKQSNDDCLREILQVVAVGVAALEAHGIQERDYRIVRKAGNKDRKKGRG